MRVANLEASMTIRGGDGQERPLVQSFVNLEARVLQQQQQTPSNMEKIERLIDAKLRSAIVAMQPIERQSQPKQDFFQTNIGVESNPRCWQGDRREELSAMEQEDEECAGTNPSAIKRNARSGEDVGRRNHPAQRQQ